MAQDPHYKNKIPPHLGDDQDSSSQSGESGASDGGGASGQIEFRDFLAVSERIRDDLLPEVERRRLLSVHKDSHQLRVERQKKLREYRKAVKDGIIKAHRQGLNAQDMGYKANPVLADKAQFSGIDSQVTSIPNEHVADTNPEDREELKLRLGYRAELQPKFNPKPQFNR